MWTTIGYKDAMENGNSVRIYDDKTEMTFEDYNDAISYGVYLVGKYQCQVDTYQKDVITAGALNITELKKQDALAKLTAEERSILGV